MPTVKYGPRKVDTAALPGVRRQAAETPESLGAGVALQRARTLTQVGALAGQLGEHALSVRETLVNRERVRADNTALLEADNQIATWEAQRVTEALRVKGKDAMVLPEQINDEYKKLTGEIEKGLSTDTQKQAFLKLKLQRGQSIDMTLRRHVAGEMDRYQAQELNAKIDNGVNTAMQNAMDPRRVAEELGTVVSAIKTSGKDLGLGPEQITQQVGIATSKVHVGVIEQLLANDQDKAASIYFEEAKDQIAGEQVARVQKAIDEGSLRGSAQRQADTILAAGGTLTEQREKARAIDDPKLRDAVTERLEHEANVRDRETRDTDEATLKGAFDIVDKTKNVAKIPPATWASLSGAARSSLRNYAENLVQGVPTKTDLGTYYGLLRQAGDNPTDFINKNLLEVRGKLGESEFKQLASLQLSLRAGDTKKADAALDGFRTNTQIINDSLTLYGIDPNAKAATPEGQAVAQLYRMLDLRVEQLAQTTGKKPTNDDIQRMTDQILSTKSDVPGSWWALWSPSKYDLNDKTTPLVKLTISDIPASQRKLIEDALARAHRPISDATILNLYIETKLRTGGK